MPRRIEPESLHGAGSAFLSNRALAPGLASVRSYEKEGIARKRILDLAGRPAMFEIVKLQLIERSAPHTRGWLLPRRPAIVAHQQSRIERCRLGMQVSGD